MPIDSGRRERSERSGCAFYGDVSVETLMLEDNEEVLVFEEDEDEIGPDNPSLTQWWRPENYRYRSWRLFWNFCIRRRRRQFPSAPVVLGLNWMLLNYSAGAMWRVLPAFDGGGCVQGCSVWGVYRDIRKLDIKRFVV